MTYQRVTRYNVSALPEGFSVDSHCWDVTVEYRGHGKWAVLQGSCCLGDDGEWSWEPLPSSREDDWLEHHRFTEEEALRLAGEHAWDVCINGLTPVDLIRLHPEAKP